MPLIIDNKYSNQYGETSLIGEIQEEKPTYGDIPFGNNTVIAITQINRNILLLIDGVHTFQKSEVTHKKNSGSTFGINKEGKLTEIQIGTIKIENQLLLILLHKAIFQCDMGTQYVLQIMKKIDNNKLIEGEYHGNFNYFLDMDLYGNGNNGVLKYDYNFLSQYLLGEDDRFKSKSITKIIRV